MKQALRPQIQQVTLPRILRGVLALCRKEINRFLKVYHQTIISPIVNALLYLAVFVLAFNRSALLVEGIQLSIFVSAGLVGMAIMQAAFSNTSSVLVQAKLMGYIIDYLMPPFRPLEIIFALVVGSVTRALIVGSLLSLCLGQLTGLSIYSVPTLLCYFLSASILLSLLGIMTGLLADTYDQLAAFTDYIITPLTFLSGTFYAITALPERLHVIAYANPFFYIIDGIRYSFTGVHEACLSTGLLAINACTLLVGFLCYRILCTGYRIKS